MPEITNDNVDYTKLSIVEQGFIDDFRTTENADYDSDFYAVSHNLGYTPIALVYYLEDPTASGGITASNFNGTQMPHIVLDVGPPRTPYTSFFFNVDKQSITFFRESLHTNTANTYDIYIKYFLFSQPTLN